MIEGHLARREQDHGCGGGKTKTVEEKAGTKWEGKGTGGRGRKGPRGAKAHGGAQDRTGQALVCFGLAGLLSCGSWLSPFESLQILGTGLAGTLVGSSPMDCGTSKGFRTVTYSWLSAP